MVSTNETSIHLWLPSRKNKNRPSKDTLLKTIFHYTNVPIDLRLLNIEELIELITWFETPKEINNIPPEASNKKPYVDYLKGVCPKVTNSSRLPVTAIQKLCGVIYEHANKK